MREGRLHGKGRMDSAASLPTSLARRGWSSRGKYLRICSLKILRISRRCSQSRVTERRTPSPFRRQVLPAVVMHVRLDHPALIFCNVTVRLCVLLNATSCITAIFFSALCAHSQHFALEGFLALLTSPVFVNLKNYEKLQHCVMSKSPLSLFALLRSEAPYFGCIRLSLACSAINLWFIQAEYSVLKSGMILREKRKQM